MILIPGNTDLNRGDQALVWESINIIKDVYDSPEVVLMKGDDHRQYSQTEKLGYTMIHYILKHPARFFSQRQHIRYSVLDIFLIGIVALFDFVTSSLLLIRSKWVNRFALLFMSKDTKRSFETFRTCDAVYVKGGGFIHSYGAVSDAYQMYFLLYYIFLAIRHKKKIVMLPNSIGPLKSKLAGWLADYALNHCTYLSVRESASEQFLLSRRSIKVPVNRHADLGFFLTLDDKFDTTSYLKSYNIDISKPTVCITLRPYRFPGDAEPEKKYNNYIHSMSSLISHLANKKYQVVLFSHTLGPGAHENDTIAVKEVSSFLEGNSIKHVCIEDPFLDCRQVMAIYSRFTFLIGTRFHSVIFAQNSFVPTIAIAYGGNKGTGIMKDSGLSDYSIPMNDLNENKIIAMFNKLESNIYEVQYILREQRVKINNDRGKMIKNIQTVLLGQDTNS